MARLILLMTLACFALLSATEAAGAVTHQVSDLDTLAELLEGKAQPGDVIEIQPGTYLLDRPRIFVTVSGTPEYPIIVRGKVENGVRPAICASETNVRNGIFFMSTESSDIVLENLELRNAQGDMRGSEQAFSRNAAGVFIEGTNITVRNCRIHRNENGIFTTRNANFVLVENCDIGHNGRLEHERSDGRQLNPHRTHNFYVSWQHQIYKNCRIHNAADSQNFKSRGRNTIFAFNWVEEDFVYNVEVASGGDRNTLWLGNVVMKRTYRGHGQGRLLGIGDGTGVAVGTLVALNNTFITYFPRDFYFFNERSSTGDAIFINNVFAGPAERFAWLYGHGTVTGKNNWIAAVAGEIPDGLENSTRGTDPGFVNHLAQDFRLRSDSPLVNAGVSQDEYMQAIRLVTQYSRGDGDVEPSPIYLAALEEIERPYPAFEPIRKGYGFRPRSGEESTDIGAYGFDGPAW